MRSGITRGGVIALMLLAALVFTSPASAQDDQKFAVVELTALRTPGSSRLAPVEVSVLSQRAIDATLVIEHRRENLDWRFDLAIPANSEVSEVFLAPSLRGTDLEASLVVDGEVIDRTNLGGFGGNLSDNAVGVFGLDAAAEQVPLDPPVGTASIIPMDDLSLLNGLDSVVTSAGGLGLLEDAELRELITWTSAGHQLIIAGEPGSADRFLPWTARTNVVWADAGLIRYVGNDWQRSVAPGVTSSGEQGQLIQLNNFGPGPSHQEILSDAGFRIPGLGPLASLLLVYVAVAGPIAFLVLRSRGEQKLLWVVVPALSALFTFGVLGAGGLLNRGRGDAHAQIVEISSVGRYTTESFVLADDGEQSVELPPGWQILSTTLGGNRFEGGGSAVEIERTRTTNTLNFDIDPGSAGTATVVGFDESTDDGLRVDDVSARNGTVTATIINGTNAALEDVVALVGDGLTTIGRLDSGQSITVEIPGDARNGVNNPEVRAWNVNGWFDWNGADLSNDEVTDGPINASSWFEWRASRIGTGTPAGTVTAIGWTRDGDGVVLDGNGRTAFVARQVIERIDGPAGAGMVRSIPVGSPVLFGEFQNTNDAVHQVLRPAGADTSELAFSVPADVSEVAVWNNDDGFRVFDIRERDMQTVRLPDDQWVDDTMWIRTRHNGFDGGGVQLVIVRATDRTLEPEVLAAGERSERAVFGNDFGPEFGPDFNGGVFETLFVGEEPTVINGFVEGGWDEYEFEVTAGDSVSVLMRSVDFDTGFGPNAPYVELYEPTGGLVASAGDEDGVGASFDHVAGETGWYRVEASVGFTGGPPFGEYELTLSVSPGGDE